VFRLAAFAIVLTVAAGPSVGLLCTSWCSPQVAAASGCHHKGSGSAVVLVAADECDDAIVGTAAFLPQDAQRGMSAPNRDHGIPVPRYQLATRPIDCRARPSATPERLLEPRSLSTTLRI
jgi:hypothetical protein